MRLKPGVSLKGLQPQMALVMVVAESAWREVGRLFVPGLNTGEPTITSGSDGAHGPDSLHYVGRALDFRTKSLTTEGAKHAFADQMRAYLGDEFDVVLEHVGGSNEHLHVEYDPK